jgi:hypothetical protein
MSRRVVAAVLAVAVGAAVPVLARDSTVAAPAQSKLVQTNPSDVTPRVTGTANDVYAMVAKGWTIIAGGKITQVTSASGAVYTRSNLMAFSGNNGAVYAWAPATNGAVRALDLSPDGRYLYVGGDFTTVGGVAVRGLFKWDLTTNTRVAGFAPAMNGNVRDLKLVGSNLLVAGDFTAAGGAARTAMASLNPTTGAATSYLNLGITGTMSTGMKTSVSKFRVFPNSTRLVLIGNFTTISGRGRRHAAMVYLTSTSAVLGGWTSTYFYYGCSSVWPAWLTDVDVSPDGKYFALVAGGGAVAGRLCDTVSRWENDPSKGTPTWMNYTGGDTLRSVAITGAAVYVGGHQRWADNPPSPGVPCTNDDGTPGTAGYNCKGPTAVDRPGIGAISPTTGKALSWNPTRSRGIGASELFVTNTPGIAGLWIGSDNSLSSYYLAGEYRPGIGYLPL